MIFFLLGIGVCSAQSGASLRFADELVVEKQFDLAVLEYRRAASERPELWRDPDFLEKLLQARFLSGKAEEIPLLTEKVRQMNPSSEALCLTAIFDGKGLYLLERFSDASSSFEKAYAGCTDPLKDQAAYWNGLTKMESRAWREAAMNFSKVSPDSPWAEMAGRARAAADSGRSEVKKKSPTVAAILGGIPGGGYLYAGSPQTAIAAFVTTGLFAWGTVSAARKDETGVAVLLGVFTAGWYFGGIHGGAVAARKYNARTLSRYIDPFRLH